MTGSFRRVIASALAWIVGAVAAVGVGVLALSLIGDGLTSRTVQPLTPDVVAREAAAASAQQPAPASPTVDAGLEAAPAPVPSAPPPSPSSAPSLRKTAVPVGTEKLVSSPGGTVIARCSGGQVYLVSWSPAQGFRSDSVNRGPAAQTDVTFEADNAKVHVAVRCAAGEPKATVSQRAEDNGGPG